MKKLTSFLVLSRWFACLVTGCCSLTLFGALPLGATARSVSDEAPGPVRILLITGGGWHDFKAQEAILTRGISERLDVEVEFTVDHEAGDDPTAELERFQSADWAEGFDLVLYNMSLSREQKAETAQAIIDSHVKHGVPAVVLHGSVHSYRFSGNENWFRFVGVRSMKHEAPRAFANEVMDPDHPVMAGISDPWSLEREELYVVEVMYPSVRPLARAYGVETEDHHPTVWVNEYEGLRIFATTIGHHTETMASDTYLDLVSRGVQWATGAQPRS